MNETHELSSLSATSVTDWSEYVQPATERIHASFHFYVYIFY